MILFHGIVLFFCISAAMSTANGDNSGRCYSPDNRISQCTGTFSNPAGLVIYVDLPLTCSGYIRKYQFNPINFGTVFVGIFRPLVDTPSQWQMIGYNKVIADESMTLNTWQGAIISPDDRILTEEGDVIGLFTYANATKQVIGFNEDGSSRIIRTDDTRESMEINDVYEGVGDYSRRRFGLNAIIEQKGELVPVYEGCFHDNIYDRDFIESTKWVDTEIMTIPLCAAHCDGLNYEYIGLQDTHACRCGDSYRDSNPSTRCNKPCRGLPSTMCGGKSRNSVYKITHQ